MTERGAARCGAFARRLRARAQRAVLGRRRARHRHRRDLRARCRAACAAACGWKPRVSIRAAFELEPAGRPCLAPDRALRTGARGDGAARPLLATGSAISTPTGATSRWRRVPFLDLVARASWATARACSTRPSADASGPLALSLAFAADGQAAKSPRPRKPACRTTPLARRAPNPQRGAARLCSIARGRAVLRARAHRASARRRGCGLDARERSTRPLRLAGRQGDAAVPDAEGGG